MNRSTIERAQSVVELESIGVWLEHVERELDAWRADMHVWLGESAGSAMTDASDWLLGGVIALVALSMVIPLSVGEDMS